MTNFGYVKITISCHEMALSLLIRGEFWVHCLKHFLKKEERVQNWQYLFEFKIAKIKLICSSSKLEQAC